MSPLERLSPRVHAWQTAFSLSTAAMLSWTVPRLLQLPSSSRWSVALALVGTLLLGTALANTWTWLRLKRYRFMLRTLSLDQREGSSATLDPSVVASFANEPARLTRAWLGWHALSATLLLSPLRPEPLDVTSAIAVVLLGTLMLATASLPMHVLVRHDFLGVIDLAPPAVMRTAMTEFENTARARGRTNRRIVTAVTLPVLFVALGSALIVNAHLRQDDSANREQTARFLARAAFELEPGGVVGLERALDRAAALGFTAQIASPERRHGRILERSVILERSGIAELTTRLESGDARVRFNASTVAVLGAAPVIVSLLAVVAAAIIGYLLGNVLGMDLYYATRGVRLLGANSAGLRQHTGVLRPPRLRLVADLAAAIDHLTDRFGVFARAQEKAIEARSTAVRTRGLFFASVSHDLKAPLNSILGFTHLVGLQPLTRGQRESLDAIHSKARELLALIETILDAARVEEGQLSLVTDEVPFKELYESALDKAQQLHSSYTPKIFEELEERIPPVVVDRVRVVRALATLIAYSVRTNEGGKMWIRAERESENTMRIDIDVPRPAHPPTQLESMLSLSPEHRHREHRGLSLGLRLARSVVQLHGGSVRVVDRGKKGAMFCVKLPTVAVPLPIASAPLHSIPPPSSRPPEYESTSDAPEPDSIPLPPRLPSHDLDLRVDEQNVFVADLAEAGEYAERDSALPPPLISRPSGFESALPTPLPLPPPRPLSASETPLPPSSRPFTQPPPAPTSTRPAPRKTVPPPKPRKK